MIRLPADATVLIAELVAWVRGRRQRMRVEGRSMLPTLVEGDIVLIDPGRRPRIDDLVAARPAPLDGVAVIKRVTGFDEDGAAHLGSDNAEEGSDSRRWGSVPADRIDGVATVELGRVRLLTATDGVTPRSIGRWLRR